MNSTHAKAVVVIVIGGDRGAGFAVQATLGTILHLPKILRDVADQIDPDVRDLKVKDKEN